MQQDPREALAREAERLRAEREAAARDEEARRQAAIQANAEALQGGSTWLMCKAVARPILLWIAFGGLTFAAMMGFNENATAIVLAGLVIGVASLVWFGSGIARWRLWRSRLPFRVEDERVLRLGAAVTLAQVTVQFRDLAIPEDQLVELVRARVAESTVGVASARTLTIASPRIDREGSNWPVAGWFRRVARLCAEVHVAYPIESVTLGAIQTDEFYVPSGD